MKGQENVSKNKRKNKLSVRFGGGGEAVLDKTKNRMANANVSRGGGASLAGIDFKGVF